MEGQPPPVLTAASPLTNDASQKNGKHFLRRGPSEFYIPRAPTLPINSAFLARNSADDGIRTRDLLITNQLLYQLSYVGGSVENSR
jgi:hypothetical protein